MSPVEAPCYREERKTVYFVSDVHLGGSPAPLESTKQTRFLALLDRVSNEDASLFILGDLFDFWFEYKTVVPRTAFGVLARLEAMAATGIPVHYLGGNHDFWLCEFLRRETRIRVLPDGTVLESQGRRSRLYHGDGLGPGDQGYKILKKILRNPLAIWAYRWIHPDLGIPLALRSSDLSRNHTGDRKAEAEDLFRRIARPELEGEIDSVILGHFHLDVHLEREEGEMLILGDWVEAFTFARLREGRFELLRWPPDDPI